jgi:hypothetical protein
VNLDDQVWEESSSEWREFVTNRAGIDSRDAAELEDHLREQVADLVQAGLTAEEAFLIAVRRLGNVDELTREFAHEYSGRLWRQLLVDTDDNHDRNLRSWQPALLFAIGAAATIQVARLISGFPAQESGWFIRNLGLFVLPFLAAYLLHRRGLGLKHWVTALAPMAVVGGIVNLFPFASDGSTEALVAGHLPVVLWVLLAYPHAGGAIRSHERRMDFVRFTGEWLVYYALIALGGGVLIALTVGVLEPSAMVDLEAVIEWVVPSGAAGAVVIAAWLVEAKQRVVENMAPVLTMIFTPLFGVMLLAATVIYVASGLGQVFDRELLGVFDALLVVVLGLVLYGISARDTTKPAGWMDRLQLVTVAAAVLLDLAVLGTMVARIGELGFTPNRAAALGLNVVLLVSLLGTAWLLARFVAGRATFHRLERWQTAYLPVFGLWASVVVLVFPALFDFV